MKKFLTLLCLCLLMVGFSVTTAFAGDWDYIDEYHVTVAPNVEDGSLHIEARFRWTVLEEGPVEWLQIGIPNGSIREETALTDNIDSLAYDNSFMYVYFDRGYDDGESFEFAYSWVQEYMYRLVDGTMVSYDYTPGWFDEANIGLMTLTWLGVDGTAAEFYPFYSGSEGELVTEPLADGGFRMTGENLGHGATMTITAQYPSWPTELYWENSAENMPTDQWEDDFYWEDDYYYEDDSGDIGVIFTVIFIIAVIVIIRAAARGDGYAAGFGTRYVLYRGLWYPMGRDGRPRPGSVGTKHKPKPPTRGGGGFGGGSRGGGFGGGGFGGGGHCACASSCACACACACAGGGRAGCSAKNLYGAVKLSKEVSESLENKE
ncbi:MAG: hypothetical protein IJO41_07395 [Oscillospiraceae bacterium]|nr:hypothetical protein [Oscillospiraceae bacterium]